VKARRQAASDSSIASSVGVVAIRQTYLLSEIFGNANVLCFPGNRMPYAGLKNRTDRTDLVAYLATLK
jgi:cytochrome c2